MSGAVKNPVFAQNRLYLPIHEERLQKKPTLVLTAKFNGDGKEGDGKALGFFELDMTSMFFELADPQGVGLRRKVEFRRSLDMNDPLVGRCLIQIKLVGDYLTKYDSLGDGVQGAPKKALSEIHQLPSESLDFNWRMRCYAANGENLPLGDVI